MKLFDVYPILNIELKKGVGIYVFDIYGNKYLDFYGGHAVISVGHSHPYYIKSIEKQCKKIIYYSNSIFIPHKEKLSKLLGEISGYEDYHLFICNSGTEANENALKIASFHTGKKKIISFKGAFHGRTSGSASITDNYKIVTVFDSQKEVFFLNYEDLEKLEELLKKEDICAVITEGLQGISGIIDPGFSFFYEVERLCNKYNSVLIIDEVQSGYGRTGSFFYHQHYSITPDLITVAKGMGNGFPIGGVLINPKFKSYHGMLGSTFGGNYLACISGISVLKIIKNENLIENAKNMGNFIKKSLKNNDLIHNNNIVEIRGKGLMLGLKFNFPVQKLRDILVYKEKVLVGLSNNPFILRILPPLNIKEKHINLFIKKLKKALSILNKHEN